MKSSGVKLIFQPPEGTNSTEATDYYFDRLDREFFRARGVAKLRANVVVVLVAVGGGTVTTLGALSAFLSGGTGTANGVIGIATAAVGATVSALTAWDSHFRHREVWIQRSVILSELQASRRGWEMLKRSSRKPDPSTAMSEIDRILALDINSWVRIRVPQRDK